MFVDKEAYSVVSLIIPQGRLNTCLSNVLAQWPYNAIHFDCRGTMIRERWFQSFLPIMNPECEYLQFLVNDKDVNDFIQDLIAVNDLHLPGAGAVFATKCINYTTNSEATFAKVHDGDAVYSAETSTPATLKENLYGIFALIQTGRTEQAIKAAMQAGSHGPIVYFVEGRGTRDRVGWLKITKKPYEEVVMVLVEDIDRARVKEALVSAGRVGALGGGIVFEMPLDRGLINLPTSLKNRNQLASNEQIIAAVDQLMGNTDWRDTRSLDSLLDKGKANVQSGEIKKNVALCVLIPRKYADDFLDYVLTIGVPGVNINYTKLFADDDGKNKSHLTIHRELVQIRMILDMDECSGFRSTLQDFVIDQGYKNVTFYELEVEGVVRYQFKPKEKVKNVYRGASVSSSQSSAK